MIRNAVLFSLVVAFMGACTCNTQPGTGEKIGQVVKLSKVGIRCQTWEGQLIRGGMNGGSGSFGTVPFDFTIERESDAALVQHFMETQTEIRLRYRTDFLRSACASESDNHFFESAVPVSDTTKGRTP